MKKLESDNFKEIVSSGVWIVDFYADWCGPCKMLTPVLESLEYDNILKVNIDEFHNISNNYGIMSIPTLIFLKDGEEKNKIIGFTDLETIKDALEEYGR